MGHTAAFKAESAGFVMTQQALWQTEVLYVRGFVGL